MSKCHIPHCENHALSGQDMCLECKTRKMRAVHEDRFIPLGARTGRFYGPPIDNPADVPEFAEHLRQPIPSREEFPPGFWTQQLAEAMKDVGIKSALVALPLVQPAKGLWLDRVIKERQGEGFEEILEAVENAGKATTLQSHEFDTWADQSAEEILEQLETMVGLIAASKWPKGGLEVKFCPGCGFRWIRSTAQKEIDGDLFRRWECHTCNIQLLRIDCEFGAVERILPMVFTHHVPEIKITGEWTI